MALTGEGGEGDLKESLADLYRRLYDPLHRHLCHLVGDADLAAELTQETFLQAMLSLPHYRGEASLSTWLYAIARNVYRKRIAREVRRRKAGELAPEPTPAPAPPEAAVRSEERARLAAALAALPEAYRSPLVMREYEGMSYAEIGHLLGRTETWARVTCFRARQLLKEAYLNGNGG